MHAITVAIIVGFIFCHNTLDMALRLAMDDSVLQFQIAMAVSLKSFRFAMIARLIVAVSDYGRLDASVLVLG